MSNNTESVKKKLETDFCFFLFIVWKHLNLPNPTPIQNDIARALQNRPKRFIIEAFRGVGKSFITGAFVLWLLYRNPQLKILVVSASKDRSDAFSSFVKRLINEMPILEHLRAKVSQRDSLVSFDVGPATVDQSPSVKSVGITGQLTGTRADIIIADDIEVKNNSATQTARDKLSELVKEFDAILKPYDPNTMDIEPGILFLGTPQTEMSIYNTLWKERGYKVRIWPAEYPNNVERYQGHLAPLIHDQLKSFPNLIGKPTDPQRFTYEDLMERKASYGKAGYSLQFMLDTTLSDAEKYPLKLADLLVTELDKLKAAPDYAIGRKQENKLDIPMLGLADDGYFRPEWMSRERVPYQAAILVIDPSGRGKDETAYTLLKELNGYLHLLECGGFKDGYSDGTLIKLCNIAKAYQVNEVVIEANYGDGMFTQLLRPHLKKIHPCSIEEVKNHTNKEARIIDTLEPVMMQHRLVVNPWTIEKDYEETKEKPEYSLFYQMARITYERGCLAFDDRLDCLAIGVQYFNSQMDTDANEQELIRQAEELERFIEESQSFFSPGAECW